MNRIATRFRCTMMQITDGFLRLPRTAFALFSAGFARLLNHCSVCIRLYRSRVNIDRHNTPQIRGRRRLLGHFARRRNTLLDCRRTTFTTAS